MQTTTRLHSRQDCDSKCVWHAGNRNPDWMKAAAAKAQAENRRVAA